MLSTLFLLAEDTPKPPPGFDFLPLLLLGFMFIFLIIMPARRDRRQRQAMLAAVDKGARVVVGGGIIGVVDKVEKTEGGEDELLIKIDPNANLKMRVLRSSVSRVLQPEKKDAKEGA
jgi:preprotein translocase subunit YajC